MTEQKLEEKPKNIGRNVAITLATLMALGAGAVGVDAHNRTANLDKELQATIQKYERNSNAKEKQIGNLRSELKTKTTDIEGLKAQVKAADANANKAIDQNAKQEGDITELKK